MKHIFCGLLSALLLLGLGACAQTPGGPGPAETLPPAAVSEGTGQEAAVMRLKIATVSENSFLGMGVGDRATPGELYVVPTKDAAYATDTPLAPGMVVDVFYDGLVQETYPATIAKPARIALTDTEDDLVGFYVGVLKEIYEYDPALNSEIDKLAFDLSETANLSESEKAALAYRMGCEYGMETLSGTYEGLCEQGYIDKENLYFPDGLLFQINQVEQKSETEFTFSLSKWRSGTGAVGMDDCTAERTGNQWHFTPGGMWIS